MDIFIAKLDYIAFAVIKDLHKYWLCLHYPQSLQGDYIFAKISSCFTFFRIIGTSFTDTTWYINIRDPTILNFTTM